MVAAPSLQPKEQRMKKYRVLEGSYINGALVSAGTIVEFPDDFEAGKNLELVDDGGTTASPEPVEPVEPAVEPTEPVVPSEPVSETIQPVEE